MVVLEEMEAVREVEDVLPRESGGGAASSRGAAGARDERRRVTRRTAVGRQLGSWAFEDGSRKKADRALQVESHSRASILIDHAEEQ